MKSPVKVLQEKPLILEPVLIKPLEALTDCNDAKEKENVGLTVGAKRKSSTTDSQEASEVDPKPKRPRRSGVRSIYAKNQDSAGDESQSLLGGAQTSTRTGSGKSNKYGETPLHVAARKGDRAKVESLLKNQVWPLCRPIYSVCRFARPEQISSVPSSDTAVCASSTEFF